MVTVTGCLNPDSAVLIIAQQHLFADALREIAKQYDDNIKNGIVHFLDHAEGTSLESIAHDLDSEEKPIFIYNQLRQETKKSDILYAEIIRSAMADLCHTAYCYDDFVVVLPCSISGGYISQKFIRV